MRKRKTNDLVPFEKCKKVIRVERRRREVVRDSKAAVFFCILGILCVLYCAGIAVVGFGTYFFLIWGVLGAFFLLLCLLLRSRRVMDAIPGWLKVLCCAIFFLGVILFCAVEGMILAKYSAKAAPGAEYCIVLGAQWKATGPSGALRRRLDAAVDYLAQNPGTTGIVSGGQGANETITEAAGMREYLIEKGIPGERIRMEDRSGNTFENLAFCGELLDRKDDRVVVVTNDFHMFRALKIAQRQGYARVEGLSAGSVPGMAPHNLLREFFGVVKDFFVGNL